MGGASRAASAGSTGALPPVLLILDMNGVLLVRPKGGREAELRPHLDALLATMQDLMLQGTLKVAVWSSMMWHNLNPLVDTAFGDVAKELEFVWDQSSCTERWVRGMSKPLLRKDLVWLEDSWWHKHMPDRVLLIDDDPIKCTENPKGTAVHPTSFTGENEGDRELLRLAAYLRRLVSTRGRSVREFVLANPYESFEDEPPNKKKRLERPPPEQLPRDKLPPPAPFRALVLKAGVEVEAFWPDESLPYGGAWMPASVLKVLKDGQIDIAWKEDGSESTLPPGYIRRLRS